jgi:phage terminase large subunit
MYNDVYLPYLSNPKNTEIFYGGSSSGKSNFVASRAIEDVLSGGHNYLCCRKMGNSLTKSVFNELEKAIIKFGVKELFKIVPSQGHITCVNGYQILFSGLDDVEKIKSITPKKGVITDIWIEEATETARTDIKQLRKRLRGMAVYDGKRIRKRIILSFNPIYRTHWIVQEFFTPNNWKEGQTSFENDKLRILKTTHPDNRFLDEEDHEELENETDTYWYEVYTLGNWGTLGDVILRNWRVADLSKRNDLNDIRNGLDFGFSNDPAAFTKNHYDRMRKKIYVLDGFHQTHLTNPELAKKIKPLLKDGLVFCDSAEPKSIKELKDLGVDAKGVKKGKDSLLYSIQWLQQHEIIVDSKLQGVVNELNTWEWKKDKDGESLPIPIDKNNHYIDSIRYAHEIEYMGVRGLDLS